MVDTFVYSERIEEIKPLTLNMVLYEMNGYLVCEFRKRITITENNKDFFKKFFSTSLSGTPINIEAQVVFRDEVNSAIRLKKFGLLSINISMRDEIKEVLQKK